MPGNAFVYGTLMADEVLKLLIQRVPVSRPAHITGFTRYKVKGQVFPAIIPTERTAKVNGKVLLDLSDKELHVLDGMQHWLVAVVGGISEALPPCPLPAT